MEVRYLENVINFDLLKEYDTTLKDVLQVWTKQKAYSLGDKVKYKGHLLECTTAGTSGTTTINFTNLDIGDTITDGTVVWEIIEPPSGGGGTSISEWETSTKYKEGDIIIYANSLYRCNTEHESSTFSTDISNWNLVYADTKDWAGNVYYPVGVTVLNDKQLYRCNTAHTATSSFDELKWDLIGVGATTPIKMGEVGAVSWQYKLLNNHLKLDGTVLQNASITYAELLQFFQTNNLVAPTQTDYDNNKALCYYDSTTDELTLPDFLDKTVWGGNTVEEKEAGLPNIEGEITVHYGNLNTSSAIGAIYTGTSDHHPFAGTQDSSSNMCSDFLKFDASKSNSIYSDSVNTVQPPAIQLIPQIRYKKDIIKASVGDIYSDTAIGTIISHMGNTAPREYLICDGTVYNISTYQALADHINTQFGSYNFFGGDGTTTFAVPDLRGEFLRGTGTNSHTNQGSGASVGVHQDGTGHLYINKPSNNILYINGNNGQITLDNADSLFNSAGTINQGRSTFNPTSSDGYESNFSKFTSRPTNTSVLYCIKYTVASKPQSLRDWETNTSYTVGDFVIYDNTMYRCIVDHISTTFNNDASNWEVVVSASENGISEWQASTEYEVGDVLIYNDCIYRCDTAHTSTSTFDNTKFTQLTYEPEEDTDLIEDIFGGAGI